MVTVPVTRLNGLKTHIKCITQVLGASRKVTMSALLNLGQAHLPFLKEQEPSLPKRVHTFLMRGGRKSKKPGQPEKSKDSPTGSQKEWAMKNHAHHNKVL